MKQATCIQDAGNQEQDTNTKPRFVAAQLPSCEPGSSGAAGSLAKVLVVGRVRNVAKGRVMKRKAECGFWVLPLNGHVPPPSFYALAEAMTIIVNY